jgi:hypothetical protein
MMQLDLGITDNFFAQLNSFCESNSHADNTPYVLYYCPVLPSSAGSGRRVTARRHVKSGTIHSIRKAVPAGIIVLWEHPTSFVRV